MDQSTGLNTVVRPTVSLLPRLENHWEFPICARWRNIFRVTYGSPLADRKSGCSTGSLASRA